MYHIRVMYLAKLDGRDVERERNFECPDYEITKIRPGHPFTLTPNQITGVPTEPGIYLRGGGATPKTVHLPNDGHTIFVMNADGQTVHTYRWPMNDEPKSEAKEA